MFLHCCVPCIWSFTLSHHHHHEPASFPAAKFTFAVLFQFSLAIALLWWTMPDLVRGELSQPWQLIGLTLLLGVPLSLFEYLYHRYLLHSAVLPFLGAMHAAHREHHGLTNVKAPILVNEPDTMVPVESRYSVEHAHQEASQMFPLFALSLFYLFFGLAMAWPLKAMFPSSPAVFATLLCVTLFYVAYEVWHAILHLPYEQTWKRFMDHPKWRRVTRFVYSFHLMHHWRPTANLAVVGLWGIALWDHVFRTHRRPHHLPLHQSKVNFKDAQLAQPLWPIRALDRLQAPMVKGSRAIERVLLRPFIKSK
jgi:hypothetical protein